MEIAETMALHPEWSDAEVSRQLGAARATICNLRKREEFKRYLEECTNKQWAEAGRKARKQMEQLADAGDFRAIEFILKTNGINPSNIIEANVNEVVVTIDD